MNKFWELRIKYLEYKGGLETEVKNYDSLFFASIEECMAYILESDLDIRKVEIILRNLTVYKARITLNEEV